MLKNQFRFEGKKKKKKKNIFSNGEIDQFINIFMLFLGKNFLKKAFDDIINNQIIL